MKTTRLLTTATASLLLALGTASAQIKEQAPERGPAAQQNAPAEKVAPPARGKERGTPETTGQGATQEPKSAPGPQRRDQPSAAPERDTPQAPRGTTGQGTQEPGARGSGTTEPRATEPSPAQPRSGQRQEQRSTPDVQKSDGAVQNRGTTGQGSASGAAKLSTEQRTKITTVIRQQNVQRVQPTQLNVSIRVGTRVPRSVRFYPLPADVITIYPEWRGFVYILVGDQIVVIEPDTYEIVAILEA